MSPESEIAGRSGETSTVRTVVRTVTPGYRGRANTEMHTIGLLYAALLAVLLVPLLPFVAVVLAVWWIDRAVRSVVGGGTEGRETRTGRRRRGRAA